MVKNRTLLVDSSFLLKQSINGNKTSYTNSFGHIGGLYTYFTILRKIIKEHGINKVINVWDGDNGGIYRHRIDKAYKANRASKQWNKIVLTDREIELEEKKKESLLKQKIRIQQYSEELYIRQIQVENIEADDLIAKYVMDKHDTEDIIIYTNDRDFCQLLDYNINILFGNINYLINKTNFMMEFPYLYKNALTMKIICGDTSDNIEGIAGIKEKSLINYFPELAYREMSVREVCQEAKKINENRILEKKKPIKSLDNLLSNIDRLRTNYKLINLNEPILNNDAIEELAILDQPLSPEGRDSKNLYNMMKEDEFLFIYGGTFVNYVEPFYSVIMNEQKIFKNS